MWGLLTRGKESSGGGKKLKREKTSMIAMTKVQREIMKKQYSEKGVPGKKEKEQGVRRKIIFVKKKGHTKSLDIWPTVGPLDTLEHRKLVSNQDASQRLP